MRPEREEDTQGERLEIAAGAAADGCRDGCGCLALLLLLGVLAIFVLVLAVLLYVLLISDSWVAQGLGIAGVLVVAAVILLFIAAYLNPGKWRR